MIERLPVIELVEIRSSAAEITAVWLPAKDIPGFKQPAPMTRPAEPYPFPIKMFPEYGADLPLWPQGWMSLSQLPLSDELRAALAAWNDFYDKHHHWETGWNVDPGEFNRLGRELFEKTRVELGPDYLLTYHY